VGFHVRLDDESNQLIRLVQSDPSKAFGRLYSAYMLFLIGERDESELKWLLDNAKALDSLTGRHIAYAVFAKQFKVKLRTHSSESDRAPRTVGQIGLGEIQASQNVTRLVKDGSFGMVVDGDEITAITYGTDMVARELGLLQKLPCLVIVDAIPAKRLCVITLDEGVTSSLMGLLRKAIAEFQASGGDTTIRDDAEHLLEIQKSISSENNRGDSLRGELKRAKETIDKLKAKLEGGASTASVSYLEQILQKRQSDIQGYIAELEKLPQTSPERLAALDAELRDAAREHRRHEDLLFSRVFERHVRALGLQTRMDAAKANTLGYIGNVLKPEFLIKVWGIVSP